MSRSRSMRVLPDDEPLPHVDVDDQRTMIRQRRSWGRAPATAKARVVGEDVIELPLRGLRGKCCRTCQSTHPRPPRRRARGQVQVAHQQVGAGKSAQILDQPPQLAAMRSGMEPGRSAPPCGAVMMMGELPAKYSM